MRHHVGYSVCRNCRHTVGVLDTGHGLIFRVHGTASGITICDGSNATVTRIDEPLTVNTWKPHLPAAMYPDGVRAGRP